MVTVEKEKLKNLQRSNRLNAPISRLKLTRWRPIAEMKNVNKSLTKKLNSVKYSASILSKFCSTKPKTFPNVIDLLSQKLFDAQVATMRQCI